MGASKHTPGPWTAFNMVHAERGDAMTPEELGEYVANSVRKSIEGGGSADRFLFVSGGGDDAPDVCHVGNGPRGPFNAQLIAAAPALLDALHDLALAMAAILGRPEDASLRPHALHFLERANAALVSATPSDTHEVG